MCKKFVENTFIIVNRETGRKYECVEQMIDLNFNGKLVHRYNVGINNYVNWHPVEMIYKEDMLHEKYIVDLDSYAKYIGLDDETSTWYEEMMRGEKEWI
jgi:hypothetical protein